MATSLGEEHNVIAIPELQSERQQIKNAFTEALKEVQQWGSEHINNLHAIAPWKLAHSYNVSFTAYYLARNHFNYSEQEALKFLKIGILHDLGFAYVENAKHILNKEGFLEEDEFEAQKAHVANTLHLKNMPANDEYAYMKKIIRGHHQFQYESYPERTAEEEKIDREKDILKNRDNYLHKLYLDRKILALADQAEAMTAEGLSERRYLKKLYGTLSREDAKEKRRKDAEFNMRHSRPDRRTGKVITTDFFTDEEVDAAVAAAQVVFTQESDLIQAYFPELV